MTGVQFVAESRTRQVSLHPGSAQVLYLSLIYINRGMDKREFGLVGNEEMCHM